jgi:hypothetical protein
LSSRYSSIISIESADLAIRYPDCGDDARTANITKGLQTAIDAMRSKAPRATIIVNSNLSKVADGKKVRYLNINDKLADRNGEWFGDSGKPKTPGGASPIRRLKTCNPVWSL